MKRTAERQITKGDVAASDASEDAEETSSGFSKATPQVMATRRIVRARRSIGTGATPDKNMAPQIDAKANPFAALPAAAKNDATVKPAKGVPTGDASQRSDEKESVPNDGEKTVPNAVNADTEDVRHARPDGRTSTKRDEASTARVSRSVGIVNGVGNNPQTETKESSIPEGSEEVGFEKQSTAHGDPPGMQDKQAEGTSSASAQGVAGNTDKKRAAAVQEPGVSNLFSSKVQGKAGDANGLAKKPVPFTFGASAPEGAAMTFADAAAGDKGKEAFSFKVPTFSPADKPSASLATTASQPQPAKFVETPVQTGEEDETEAFRVRAKVYGLEASGDKASARWRERGVGQLKLNVHKETKRARLLMRTEATLRLTMNAPLFPEFKIDRASERSVRFHCISAEQDQQPKGTSFLVRFSTEDDANRLITAVNRWKGVPSGSSGRANE